MLNSCSLRRGRIEARLLRATALCAPRNSSRTDSLATILKLAEAAQNSWCRLPLALDANASLIYANTIEIDQVVQTKNTKYSRYPLQLSE